VKEPEMGRVLDGAAGGPMEPTVDAILELCRVNDAVLETPVEEVTGRDRGSPMDPSPGELDPVPITDEWRVKDEVLATPGATPMTAMEGLLRTSSVPNVRADDAEGAMPRVEAGRSRSIPLSADETTPIVVVVRRSPLISSIGCTADRRSEDSVCLGAIEFECLDTRWGASGLAATLARVWVCAKVR